MTIIGIDPGTVLAGYASSDGKQVGVWQLKGSMASRMAQLYGWVFTLVATNMGATFAVEVPVGGFKGNGAHELYAVGVIMAALGHWAAPVVEVNPSQAKAALCGTGGPRVDKAAMIAAAGHFHNIDEAKVWLWVAQGRTQKQAEELAATAADAYGIALAGLAKLAAS